MSSGLRSGSQVAARLRADRGIDLHFHFQLLAQVYESIQPGPRLGISLFGALTYFVQKYFHPESADPASFRKLVLYFAAFLVIDFIASAIAFALERRTPEAREDLWLLSQVWLQRFAYRQLFSIVLFKTLKRALGGQPFAWDKLERTAAVSYRPSENRPTAKVP